MADYNKEDKMVKQDDKKQDGERQETGNFIHQIVEEEMQPGGRVEGQTIYTRFPPEPNGFLHIGHAKAICIDFGTAEKYHGYCNLRMDDTNPGKEDPLFVEAIKNDVQWLGFHWEKFTTASQFFDEMYEKAKILIRKGLAYVDDLTGDQVRETRGTLTEPGKESPCRNRSVEENLDLFERMRNGEFADGEKTLRAKIDMASGNINMRDPILYRVDHKTHQRTGDKWCIYPMYDYAHPLEDAFEGITHSLCTLEFENHRPLYNWVIENTEVKHKPRQIEFAPLNISYTVLSKRKLRYMVEHGIVDGWDDPRMPTLSGLRRRGYTPQSIRTFCERVGVSKVDSMVDCRFLDYCLREDLNLTAPRAMGVLDPLKLIIDNYPEDQEEMVSLSNHPRREDMGTHQVPFGKEVWIEREDFQIDPPKKYFRLFPGNEVRLQGAYIVRCTSYDLDEKGQVTAVHAEYDPESKGGMPADGRKIKGTIHWVPVKQAVPCEVRLFDHLFSVEDPDADPRDYTELINPNSRKILTSCYVEPWLAEQAKDQRFQFMRKGYFIQDSKDSSADHLVFNQIVSLRDGYRPGN